jgi:hypothetical protein
LYSEKKGAFSLHGPADWRVAEDHGGAHRVTFYGPPPDVESIAVYRHDGEKAASYLAFQSLAGKTSSRKTVWKGRPAWEILQEQKAPVIHGRGGGLLSVRSVLIEDEKGYWALVHTAPAGKSSTDVFDALLESFRPAN